MSRARSLRDLMKIRSHNREFLDSINGTLGTALGLQEENRPSTEQGACHHRLCSSEDQSKMDPGISGPAQKNEGT